MGIPMYREPSATEASKKNAIKDSSAAARSAIRRQATIRRPSRHGTFRGASHRLDRPNLVNSMFYDTISDWNAIDRTRPSRNIGEILAREARELESLSATPPQGESPDILGGPTDANRREAGQRLLTDAARHSQPGRRLRIPRDTMLTELINRPSPGDPPRNQQSSEQPPFTPRFAPAIAYHSTVASQPNVRRSPFPRLDTPGDLGLPRVPQLRRAIEQSINDLNRPFSEPSIDGLGDRQRSLSPDDDDYAHNPWETLLTTITPDANLPSNESSFASTASATNASRSGATATSTNSTQTLPSSLDSATANVHLALDPYPEFLNPCDYPTSSDSESDPELDLEGNRQARRRRAMPRSRFIDTLRQSHDINSTMSSQPPIPTISFSFSDPSTDPEFRQMQSIISRFANGDVPDHMWVAAGLPLPPSIGSRLGGGDEARDPDGIDGARRGNI
jgi:hypothetical protein